MHYVDSQHGSRLQNVWRRVQEQIALPGVDSVVPAAAAADAADA